MSLPMQNEPHNRPRRWWVAALLSYLVPGLGQVYAGQLTRGLLAYCLYAWWGSLVFIVTLQVMRRHFPGFSFGWILFMLLIALSLLIGIIYDAIRQARKSRTHYELQIYNRSYIYILAILILLSSDYAIKFTMRDLILKPYRIPTASMGPTILPGDYLLSDKMFYCQSNPERGDIVIFQHPSQPKLEFIKRVIGLPGDTLQIVNQQVLINHQVLSEPYAQYVIPPARRTGLELSLPATPVVIPAEHFFVMGDNRDQSADSRQFSTIPRALIKGKPAVIYFSWGPKFPFVRFDRIGKKIQ
ncbi:signal peptidase I [candidate division KSB1 bacterium]|nr:signal peptidase I [candidate division KSB1 bacterium]